MPKTRIAARDLGREKPLSRAAQLERTVLNPRLYYDLAAAGLLSVAFGGLHLAAWPHGGAFDSTAARLAALFGRVPEKGVLLRPDGGLFGALITALLSPLELVGSYITLAACGISSLLLLTDVSLAGAARQLREGSQRAAVAAAEPLRAARERRAGSKQPLFLDVADIAASRAAVMTPKASKGQAALLDERASPPVAAPAEKNGVAEPVEPRAEAARVEKPER